MSKQPFFFSKKIFNKNSGGNFFCFIFLTVVFFQQQKWIIHLAFLYISIIVFGSNPKWYSKIPKTKDMKKMLVFRIFNSLFLCCDFYMNKPEQRNWAVSIFSIFFHHFEALFSEYPGNLRKSTSNLGPNKGTTPEYIPENQLPKITAEFHLLEYSKRRLKEDGRILSNPKNYQIKTGKNIGKN